MFLPAVNRYEEEEAPRFIEIMTRHLKGQPLREANAYTMHKSGKRFQEYFKAFVTNYVPQTNQTTGL